jgi:hypothetical protein
MAIQTNRDLYVAIAKLLKDQEPISRSLEEYLRSLWLLASEHQALSNFAVAGFLEILSRAFSASLPDTADSRRAALAGG